jgi:hypothetical protein
MYSSALRSIRTHEIAGSVALRAADQPARPLPKPMRRVGSSVLAVARICFIDAGRIALRHETKFLLWGKRTVFRPTRIAAANPNRNAVDAGCKPRKFPALTLIRETGNQSAEPLFLTLLAETQQAAGQRPEEVVGSGIAKSFE